MLCFHAGSVLCQSRVKLAIVNLKWKNKKPIICLKDEALVAQWIEHLPPEQGVAGSNPVEGTISYDRNC